MATQLSRTAFGGNISINSTPNDRTILTMGVGPTLTLFERAGLRLPSRADNRTGIYSYTANVDPQGNAHFMSFDTPKNNIRGKDKMCQNTFTNCGMKGEVNTMKTCEYQFAIKYCPDFLENSCWEHLKGSGVDAHNAKGNTRTFAEMINIITRRLIEGLGNDYFNITESANHPLISLAWENQTYEDCGISREDYECWYNQQTSEDCKGFLTHLDYQMMIGNPAYNGEISSEFNDDGCFVGDMCKELDKCIKLWKRHVGNTVYGRLGRIKAPIHLSTSLFDAYESTLSNNPALGASLQYKVTGDFTVPNTNLTITDQNLRYKGHPLVCRDDWDKFNGMVGQNIHRIVMAAPGAFKFAYDISPLNQFGGMGMRSEYENGLRYQGEILHKACFRVGADIEKDYIVMCTYNQGKLGLPTPKPQ